MSPKDSNGITNHLVMIKEHHQECPKSHQTCKQPGMSTDQCWLIKALHIFFPSIIDRDSKHSPLKPHVLHNVLAWPHFTVCVPFIPGSWRGGADSLSSAARPLCLISVILLMRPGPWQASGAHTKAYSVEMCPTLGSQLATRHQHPS